MSKTDKDHGSEWHLRRYLAEPSSQLSEAVLRSIQQPGKVEWKRLEGREWKGMNFLGEDVIQKWKTFWPQRGNPPNWDAIARLDTQGRSEWLLFEAKANHPEFCSPPCGAVSPQQGNHSEGSWQNQNLSGRTPRLPLAWYLLSVCEPSFLSSLLELNRKRTGAPDFCLFHWRPLP